jgi:hypothetical protein
MCPNCRQDADLEAPVDVETEAWEEILRTTDPRTPTAEPGNARDPQIKMLSFRPMPDPSEMRTQRENALSDNMQGLNLSNAPPAHLNQPSSPDRELDLTRTLSSGLPTIAENPSQLSPTQRNQFSLSTSPIAISRRVRALSAAREGFEEFPSLSATPTIDRGPFVYGDMTVNADGTAEATTSSGNIVQLPRESISDEAAASGGKSHIGTVRLEG